MHPDKAYAKSVKALKDLALQLDSDSKALDTFLDALSKFHRYSPWNTLLILAQKPEATKVAGFSTWKTLNRCVRKGEKGIAILAPILVKDETGDDRRVFKTVYVFDLSQTDGEPLPELPSVHGDPGLFLERLHSCANASGVEVVYGATKRPGILGVSMGGRILLKTGLEPPVEFSTLAHELAHELLHQIDRDNLPEKTVLELEAEASSYVVCKAVGLETGTASSDYIKLYGGDSVALARSLERIQRTACKILDCLLPG